MIHAVAKTLVTVNPHSLSEHLRLGSITPLLALCRCNKLYLYPMQYFVTSVYSVTPYYFHQIPALGLFALSLFISLSLSLYLSLSLSPSVCLSLSLSLFITHTISLSLFLSLFFSFFHSSYLLWSTVLRFRDVDASNLQQFESCLALTNLMSCGPAEQEKLASDK